MKTTARLFKNGGSQAIRLPRQFRFPGKSVTLQRTKAGVLIRPAEDRQPSLAESAKAYQAFLRAHPAERAALDEWEAAPLAD